MSWFTVVSAFGIAFAVGAFFGRWESRNLLRIRLKKILDEKTISFTGADGRALDLDTLVKEINPVYLVTDDYSKWQLLAVVLLPGIMLLAAVIAMVLAVVFG